MPAAEQSVDMLDEFIAENLPDWLSKASVEEITALRAAYAEHRASEELLVQSFADVQPPHTFAKTLLQDAIRESTGKTLDLDHALWRERWQNYSLLGGEELIVHHSFEPALDHLMQNFVENQSFDGHSGLIHAAPGQPLDTAPLLIDSKILSGICRSVDVGKHYQALLDKVVDGALSLELREEKRQRLALAVALAVVKKQLSAADVAMLRQVLAGVSPSHPDSASVSVKRLRILGCSLATGVTFELLGTPPGSLPADATRTVGIILYLAHRPLQRFASWGDLNTYCQQLLADPQGLTQILYSLQMKDRASFLTLLRKRLKDPKPDLEVTGHALSNGLFNDLTSLHIAQLRADSAYLLVSNATADENNKRSRLDTLESVGSSLLQMASFFVPGLNELLLAQMVVETLTETYEGVTDWHRGHQHEALEHLLGVAETVAVNAVLVAGGKAVAQGFKRSAFVEAMVPVQTSAGGRLWVQDLEPYRSTDKPANTKCGHDGLYRHGDRAWWRYQNHDYEVRNDPQRAQWHMVHRAGNRRFNPGLQWNGECGWRLAWQKPQQWQGARVLLEHLWPQASELDAQQCSQVLTIADIDEDGLYERVAQQQRLPVALRDTLERYVLDKRIDTFFAALHKNQPAGDEALMQACIDQLPAEDRVAARRRQSILDREHELRAWVMDKLSGDYLQRDALMVIVTKDFPRLPDVYAHDIVQQASVDQRQHMALKLALPLALSEQARQALVTSRVCRMLQGLYLKNAYSDHLPDLVFALLRRVTTWPSRTNFEVRRDSLSGHVLSRMHTLDPAYPPKVLVHHLGQMQVYEGGRRLFTDGQPAPGGLLETLLHFLPKTECERLGWTGSEAIAKMRADLQARLPEGRGHLLAMMGISTTKPRFTAPRRVSGGRFGYLLSGRGDASRLVERTLQDRLRSLYPGFDAQQLMAHLSSLERQPGSTFSALLREEESFRQLDQTLNIWSEAASSAVQRPIRRVVADELRRCWRRQGVVARNRADGQPGMALVLTGLGVRELPALATQTGFLHITEMTLVNMQLQTVPAEFLRPFGELLTLNLDNNNLTTLPSGLAHLGQLRELTMAGNRLQLNADDYTTLAGLQQLRVLDLGNNPLSTFSLGLAGLPRLRQLGLRDTSLTEIPESLGLGVSLDYVDLRDNLIDTLPQGLGDSRISLRRGLALHGNPLPLDYQQRWLGIQTPSESDASLEGEPGSMQVWQDGLLGPERVSRAIQWDRLSDEPGSGDFFQLLHDLARTSDFRVARSNLQERVWSVFDALEQNTALRRELFELASLPRSCVDSVISSFGALEVLALSSTAVSDMTNVGEAQLLSLARRLFRLDRVEAYAREDMQRRRNDGRDVDEVEVSLAYRVGLASALDLPGQPSSMQFETVAGVSESDLAAARAAVQESEAGEALITYISERDFWSRYLRQQHSDSFDALETPFWERMEALDAQRSTMDDQTYLTNVSKLASEREQVVIGEAKRLTREALARLAN
ncbi:NEL-type E3 ubiquitin ligase domain-containing protein [Pseudomonas sp. RW3S2]|uniref:NEL-type E3 ubiquitin ligase domain-containing protein n=1 Tax=Pseudomonas sp. RW3S2 TaxID=485884 RepID=UPI001648F5E4|nr:NEL-type E3 ubiquitin ligase domain-containing protein [Pseudomonas sp. RW3S2]MBC3420607.1 hypothetical protein [Pseudomonas sp. RW3S2]